MRIAAILAVLVLLADPVAAHERDRGSVPISGIELAWPRTVLEDFVSEPGQPLIDFLRVEVGPALHAYTLTHGVEACGAIATDGQRFAVRLVTDGVPQGCAVSPREAPEGFVFEGETIHSHPHGQLLPLNAAARAWSRHYRDGNERSSSIRNDGAGGFSRADRAGGAGWLVAKRQLMHQAGGRTTNYGSISDR